MSHLKGDLDSLSFAIGLREEGGQEGALERLLPMLKIQPRPAGEVCTMHARESVIILDFGFTK